MNKDIRYANKGNYAYSLRYGTSEDYGSHLHVCYEILYLIEGNALYTIEGKEYSAGPGDIIFTVPNEFHSFSFPKPCNYSRTFFHIYPAFLEKVADILPDMSIHNPGEGNLIPSSLVNKYHLYDIFEILENSCADKTDEETDAVVFGCAVQMLSIIHTILRKEDLSVSMDHVSQNVLKMMSYISEHYIENIGLQDIADHMYMDKSYIGRLFKKHTGMTIKPYINMQRILKAKNLIASGKQATDIYTECGFENYSTFYRAFKKYVGYTPEEFKKHVSIN